MSKEAKEKKDNAMTIAIIGLIGTLVAAALGSPVLVELIKDKRATETPAASVETPDGNTQVPAFTEQNIIFSDKQAHENHLQASFETIPVLF